MSSSTSNKNELNAVVQNDMDINVPSSLILNDELTLLQQEHQDLQARYNALFSLNQLSLECEDLKNFYPQVHRTIASLMTAKNFFIVNYDQTFSTMEFVYDVDEKDTTPPGITDYKDYEGSLTHLVIESMQPLLVTPNLLNELQKNGKVKLHGSTSVDWLGVPLIHDGIVIGVMVVQSYSESIRYQEKDLNLLTFAAQHVVGAMVRLQDQERLQNAVNARTKELMAQMREREKSELLQESLYRISELTNDVSIDIDTFYSKVHNIVGQLINATNFFIAKYSVKDETLQYVYVVDEALEKNHDYFQPRKLSDHYSELVIHQAESVLLNRQDMLDLYEKGKVRKPVAGEHSWLGVPLIYSGQVIGVMVIQSYHYQITYTQQDAGLLNFISHYVSTAIQRRELADIERKSHELLEKQVKYRTRALVEEIQQRKQAEKKLKHTACHDSLTGLPNRAVFINLLNHAIACNKRNPDLSFAILFLDLDRFKVVNDSLGHHAGDLLLKMVSKKLSSLVRGKDTVARLGGDEFVILIEDIGSQNEALEIASRITDLLKEPFDIENQQIFIGTSIGILFSNERYSSADTMLRDADTAMYQAKDNGKGRYEVFDGSMHKKVQNALLLETDIREAIALTEFIPFFQPILALKNQKLMGFEALARWESSKRGFVFPDDFIPLAEETNLVQAIDLQILEQSCQYLKEWQNQNICTDLYVSCNLFCDHFFSATLPADINKILLKIGLNPHNLRIELTERALLENTDIVLKNMKALSGMGVKILLDDFGTGYSSLSYLHRFPIDVLKIDRSFISNVNEHKNNKAIIKTIVDLAKNLYMTTVGEGIESSSDADLLQQMGCAYGQGYYFSKPMSAEDMKQYIINHKA